MYMARPQSKKIKKNLLNQTMKAKLKRIIGGTPDEDHLHDPPIDSDTDAAHLDTAHSDIVHPDGDDTRSEWLHSAESSPTSKSPPQKHMSDEEIDKSFGGEENTDALPFWLKKAQNTLSQIRSF